MTPTTPDPPTPGGAAPTPDPPGRNPWPWRVVIIVAALFVGLLVWLLVRDDGGSGSAATPSVAMSETEPAATSAPSATATAAAGCAPTDDATPPDADTATVVDVDGDGEADTAWLTPGADRRIGITTASGATFSAAIDSASPQPAAAVVNTVAAGDGTAPIVLVDTGREALLFSGEGCALTATENDGGDQYTFDKGFAGNGTGVGCTEAGGGLRLAGLNATTSDGGTSFTVTRTFVDLTADAATASNGMQETVAEDAGPNDLVVTTAQETSCGELVAGQDGPVEPGS